MIEKFAFLLNRRFRGCMMHYSLVDKKGFCIDPKCFDMNIPLYGLIESCFNGMAFQEYEQCLTMLSENIENLLKKQFKIKAERVKKIE